jgi:hypothetical protein
MRTREHHAQFQWVKLARSTAHAAAPHYRAMHTATPQHMQSHATATQDTAADLATGLRSIPGTTAPSHRHHLTAEPVDLARARRQPARSRPRRKIMLNLAVVCFAFIARHATKWMLDTRRVATMMRRHAVKRNYVQQETQR